MSLRVVVVGGGVAGCAAAVGAALAGAEVTLVEASRTLGGVAAAGEHRTLCGLAPIDAPAPHLLEPALTQAWVEAVSAGAPVRHGRVWLWPTNAALLQQGLAGRLAATGVGVRLGTVVTGAAMDAAGGGMLRCTARGGEATLAFDRLIDASGAGLSARWLGLAWTGPTQWGAVRLTAVLPAAAGRAGHVRWLRRLQGQLASSAALALVPLAPGTWQVSWDCPPAPSPVPALARLAAAVEAAGGQVLATTWGAAARDAGRPVATLDLPALFATTSRGLCWAAWPREEHTAEGVAWTWPPGDRHGVPPAAVHIPGAPAGWWCIGKGMPVTAAAAASLRVTGTQLALGMAVGAWAAGVEPPGGAALA